MAIREVIRFVCDDPACSDDCMTEDEAITHVEKIHVHSGSQAMKQELEYLWNKVSRDE